MPFWVLKFFIVLVLAAPVSASDFDVKKIYRKASGAVVLITGFDRGQRQTSLGTGSIISNDGLVLTNAHVIFNHDKDGPFNHLRVFLKPERISGELKKDTSRKYKAAVLKFSTTLDLALLAIEPSSASASSPTLKFSNSDLVSIGDPVIAIGHPEQGGLWTLTTGTISSHISNYRGIPGKNVFQTETSLNRGNSGGPLIDGYGHIVGINSMISRRSKDGLAITGINFSIKSQVAVDWLNSLGLKYQFVYQANEIMDQSSAKNAGIVPAPKSEPEAAPTDPELKTPEQPKTPEKSGVFTRSRPFKERDLFEQVEDDLEGMMDEVRNKLKGSRPSIADK